MTTNNQRPRWALRVATGGVLAAIATLLRFIEAPLPFFPSFLKLDLSNIPALIGGFALGPFMGGAILLVKNVLYLPASQTGGIGEIADFIISLCLVLPAALVYKYRKSRAGAVWGMAAGAVLMSALGGPLMNYYVLLPLYSQFMPMEQILALAGALNPAVDSVKAYLMYVVAPFNLLKAVVTGGIAYLLYRPLQPVLHKFR